MPNAADPLAGFDGGYEATASLLRPDRRFSAVLAFDDLTALGAIRALHEAVSTSPMRSLSLALTISLPPRLPAQPFHDLQDMSGMGVTRCPACHGDIVRNSRSPSASIRLAVPVVVARGSTSHEARPFGKK